jgi:hypothetical protein
LVPGYQDPFIPQWVCWLAMAVGWWSSAVNNLS